MSQQDLPAPPLPSSIASSYVDCSSTVGLRFHILSCGPKTAPLILLLHGFPELSFSWRKVMPLLASPSSPSQTPYHVVAYDQRGYGRTTGPLDPSDTSHHTMSQLTTDALALVHALGHTSAACIVGHDFGGTGAAMCALMRPDIFRACVLMSHPFAGTPRLPPSPQKPSKAPALADLARLPLHPRKHYKWYNSLPPAAHDWAHPEQGLHAYLRGYMHLKSGNWAPNAPFRLSSWCAEELAKMPHYYILPLHLTLPQAVARDMQTEDAAATTSWLSEAELAFYVAEWERTGFRAALNWYRTATDPDGAARELLLWAGRRIEVPCVFVTGDRDWGNFQEPGALEAMERGESCADFRGVRWVEGAGHWPQQERAEVVAREIGRFLEGL